jgi:acetyl-CoA synthetase
MSAYDEPVWMATEAEANGSNLAELMRRVGLSTYEQLHAWSIDNRGEYWRAAIDAIGLRFRHRWTTLLDTTAGVEHAKWLVGANWNLTESCFRARADSAAVIEPDGQGGLETTSVGELDSLSSRVAQSLQNRGIGAGDSVAIILPMTSVAVAAYLGVLRCGAVAVGIAESFTEPEIATRVRLSNSRLILVQDTLQRGAKRHPLYERIQANDVPAIVYSPGDEPTKLRPMDQAWSEFLVGEADFEAVPLGPDDPTGILFSSGTTGDPKTIPWSNLCPIKCAADAHYHQDVHPDDVLAWPTSLGWMMGPWLIFAALLNRATIAIYDGAPTERGFARFVERAGVSMLGVVPSLVAAWRENDILEGVDWSGIRLFSSTGECSNQSDMEWLMQRAGGRPIIEYCGGTELAGGYIANAILRPCRAATFNTPTLGVDLVVLDEDDQPADQGELFIVPPCIGLSDRLLHRDHHAVYYADCPKGPNGETLRRHGDEMQKLPDGFFRAHGRVDDTMNLGGVKVSSAEIERVISETNGVRELAAVAETPDQGGPSRLVVFAVIDGEQNPQNLREKMQTAIRSELNPLFKIAEVVIVDHLPRTASNKIMRRQLRSATR